MTNPSIDWKETLTGELLLLGLISLHPAVSGTDQSPHPFG